MAFNGPYYSVTPFVVGPDQNSQYKTIQTAITAAVAAGASNTVVKNIFIKPGTYTENLVLAAGIRLVGLGAQGDFTGNNTFLPPVTWTGTATTSGTSAKIVFKNMYILNTAANTVITPTASSQYEFIDCNLSLTGASTVGFTSTVTFGMLAYNCIINARTLVSQSAGVCQLSLFSSNTGADFAFTSTSQLAMVITGGTYTAFSTGAAFSNTSFFSLTARRASGGNLRFLGTSGTNSSIDIADCTFYSNATMFGFGAILSFTANNSFLSAATAIFNNNIGTTAGTYQIVGCTLSGSFGALYNGSSMTLVSCNTYGMTPPTLGAAATITYCACGSAGDGTLTAGQGFVVDSKELDTTATEGFLHIPACPGPPTGVPVLYGNSCPLVYDTINNELYIYSGTWRSVVVT